jgi:phosphoglycerate dehydrogenase-like enzyme
MSDIQITVLTAPDENELPGLEQLDGRARVQYARDETTLAESLTDTDVLVVTDFRTEMLERVWPAEHRIQWVHATSAGVDALMFPQLVNSDIVVTNARGIFDRGIAEYVLGAIFMFAKDTLGNLRYQREHQWRHRETALARNAQVLIVGAGSIGREVGSLLQAVDMDVIATARHERDDECFRHVYPQHKLAELLPEADYVVITAPLTEQTRELFDQEMLEHMQPSARLINVGRGPIVQTDDLVAALRDGIIAGAALDVFEEEPLPEDHPLWDLDNVMISAHMAGDFIGWRRALGIQFVDNFLRWLSGEGLYNRVDKQNGYVTTGQ